MRGLVDCAPDTHVVRSSVRGGGGGVTEVTVCVSERESQERVSRVSRESLKRESQETVSRERV